LNLEDKVRLSSANLDSGRKVFRTERLLIFEPVLKWSLGAEAGYGSKPVEEETPEPPYGGR
jgi:hypothetical protein